ncbi:acyl-CoA synthetase [Spongiibacter sp. KMU-166]|uniref:Acyl-CoA synthetase n=1 Tax=Spongiibacter thalassae TaxID=2721624 RepID=A0ABX1GIE2_9GAMM|nr:acyl-CoA synthetase [Spongiibacter thalassae]
MPHISTTAQTAPNKLAFCIAETGESVSYAELDHASNRIANLFRSLGLQKDDHIALMLENRRELIEIAQAAVRSGIIFTPLSTHLKQEEVRYILENCNAKLFVTSNQFVEQFSTLALPALKHLYNVDAQDAPQAEFTSWSSALATQPNSPIQDECLGLPMLYSSGTTGQPKGVLARLPIDSIHEVHPNMAALAAAFGINENCIYLSPAPLYHAAPLHYCMLVMQLGGSCIVMQQFDPERALKHIETYRVTHSQWVPIMFIRMLKLPEAVRNKYDVSSLQFAIHAAAPCPIEIKQQMIDWWGPIIAEYYSGSEGAGMTMIDSKSWLTHKGSVGPALVGEIRIVSDEGELLPKGEIGTVYFANGSEFEYFNEPEKTASAHNTHGWSTLGDVGYLDDDGFLYLTDRKNFMIISGGVNIYPQEIENLLITHPQIADVAVFGIPNEEYGEEVKAVVQLLNPKEASPGLAESLREWTRERLSSIKTPRSIDFTEELPRMDNGKLYKKRLIEQYKKASACA